MVTTLVSQVFLCFATGFLLTVVYGSSSWLVGEAEVNVSVGPQKPPVQGTLGVWAGLWHINLTYVTDAFSLNERVDWTSRKDFVVAHKKALSDGWPWALVSLTAELGGEGTAWHGQLGDGLRQAGLAASSLLVAAITVWAVWVLLFTVSPQVAALPIMFSGAITATCSVVYVVCVSVRIPHTLTVAGTKMELHLGFAWWVTAALGLTLTLVGLGLLLYDIYRPGQLATVFEMDFGTPNHTLSRCSWKYSKPIFAFNEDEETYSQGYPWPRLPRYFKYDKVSLDDDMVAQSKETKQCPCQASEEKQKEQAVADRRPITCPKSDKKESLSETLKTPEKGKDVVSEDEVVSTFNVSTLEHGQDHTVLSPQPTTLRRRSPEQPQEQERPPSPQEQSTTPLGMKMSDIPLTGTNTSLPDNHSTLLVEKYVPKTNALLRTPFIRRSVKNFSRFKARFPIRLSYKSPLLRKSLSLSRLVLPSEARQNFDEETNGKNEEWVEEYEEVVLDAWRESATHL